jgi:hypothetical protein
MAIAHLHRARAMAEGAQVAGAEPARAALRDLVARHGLAQEHRRFQVDLIDAVEGRFVDIHQPLLALDADAVDEYVDAAHRLGGAVGHFRNRGGVARIQREAIGLDAFDAQPLRQRFGLRPIGAGDGDMGAVPGHRQRNCLAQCAVAAGQEDAQSPDVEEPVDRIEIDLRRQMSFGPVHAAGSRAAARSVSRLPR